MPLVPIDLQTMPIVHTDDASGLISDSGIIRYRFKAKIWDIYSKDGDEYWYFPKKIHVEQFDPLFQVVGNIEADTAYFFKRKELWRAIGNVVVKNMEGRIFETSELFWDQRVPPNTVNAFYTDQPVKIIDPDGSITYGRSGFKADQSLNIIRLFSMKGEFNIDESPDSLRQNTMQPDSVKLP